MSRRDRARLNAPPLIPPRLPHRPEFSFRTSDAEPRGVGPGCYKRGMTTPKDAAGAVLTATLLAPNPAPTIITKITENIDRADLEGVWRALELYVLRSDILPPTVGVKHDVGVPFKLHDGTEIKLSNWYLWDATPAQLRALADQLEASAELPK